MITSYIRVAWRNLKQHRMLSTINITGLALGMAFALLIGMWVQFERSYDTFHVNGARIGMFMKNTQFNDRKNTQQSSPIPIYDLMLHDYPEVERATRINLAEKLSVVHGNNKVLKSGMYADPAFLHMFSFPLVAGNINTALNDVNGVIISASQAKALFGNSPAIGQLVKIDNSELQVTAVMADIPANSSWQFDLLLPFSLLEKNYPFVKEARTNWGINFAMNVVELKPGVDMQAFSQKVSGLINQHVPEHNNQFLMLQPFTRMHLYNEFRDWKAAGGRISYVNLFTMIGLFVLLIACINFMNLSTARSEKRAKEVGIRKAVGSGRSQLIAQFLSESVLTALISFVFAIVIVLILLPFLNQVGVAHVNLNGRILVYAWLVCLATGLLAGSYPAWYLSSFVPVKVLKGSVHTGRNPVTLRRILVVFQFTISIALIICTVIVFQQVKHAQTRSMGYNPDNLLSVTANDALNKNYTALKQALLNTGHFTSVTRTSQPMTSNYNKWSDFGWTGKDPGAEVAMDVIMSDWDYEATTGLQFIAGRAFDSGRPADSNAVILNEAALKTIGYTDPIGKTITSGQRTLTIIGIVKNLVLYNPYQTTYPLAIIFETYPANNILLRLKPGLAMTNVLGTTQSIFEKYNADMPFEYTFTDQDYARKFNLENQVGRLAAAFALLAILISCMGLFGLAMFMAERRTKEIGIRKVLGAGIPQLWLLLSKDFIWLVAIAAVLASPFAFYFMREWLQHYEYRISISWEIFVGAGLVACVVTMLTVSSQAVKAALVNPVKSLKTE
jgi:ABC-type antimicrobial peptide transport system permease subunit